MFGGGDATRCGGSHLRRGDGKLGMVATGFARTVRGYGDHQWGQCFQLCASFAVILSAYYRPALMCAAVRVRLSRRGLLAICRAGAYSLSLVTVTAYD